MSEPPIPERPARAPGAWRAATVVLTVLLFVMLLVGQDSPATPVLIASIAALAVAVTVWALARNRRQRRTFEQQLERWAADRAVQQERLRIARDLHDLTSHGLSLITVRAAAAAGVSGPGGDAERRAALADVARIGRDATHELRRMLTLLRTAGDDTAPLRPADTLTALPAVIDAARRGGLTVDTHLDTPTTPGPGVQLTVCAVVREALANTLRHAGPTTARVTLTRDATTTRIDVDDDGPVPGWRPEPGAGQGLTGLRERLTTHGGTLTTRPGTHGYRLRAVVPDPPC